MAELHTDTQYLREQIFSLPTQVLGAANRKRLVMLGISTIGLPIWVGENAQLTPLNGRLVNRWAGLKWELGPNQILYAVTIGPFAAILHGTVIDRHNEGLFTDDGSGDAELGGSGGSAEAQVPASPPPGTGRSARD